MSKYVTKVHSDACGDKFVAEPGGTIEIKSGATLNLKKGSSVNGLPQGDAVADSVASDVAGVVSDFNTLLASLRAAGIIASS